MEYVRPFTEMLELYTMLNPGFTDFEYLSFVSSCDDEYVYLLGTPFARDDLEGMKEFARNRFWFTYRKNFPAIGGIGPTSDSGWGCMLRCGQMLLAQTLSIMHLGRDWKWTLKCADVNYRKLLSMFEDQRSSLFSIHQIAQMGASEGKEIGAWFGPNTIAQVLKKLVVYDEWSGLAVHVAMDNLLISEDVFKMAAHQTESESNAKCADSSLSSLSWKRPLLIMIPLRLGLTVINECYLKAIKELFKLPQCVGVIGGRPNHAVYYIGQVDNKMLYLDPHVCHDIVDVSFDNVKKMNKKTNLEDDFSSTGIISPEFPMWSPLMSDNDDQRSTTNSSQMSATMSNIVTPYSTNDKKEEILVPNNQLNMETEHDKTVSIGRLDALENSNDSNKGHTSTNYSTSAIDSFAQLNIIDNESEIVNRMTDNISSNNSIIDVLSSPRLTTTDENNSSSSSSPVDYYQNSIESCGSNEPESLLKNSYTICNVPVNESKNYHHVVHDSSQKLAGCKIEFVSSCSNPSSEFSSYTEATHDSSSLMFKFEKENCRQDEISKYRELTDLPDIMATDISLLPSLCISSSSSSSTEILPSMKTTTAQNTSLKLSNLQNNSVSNVNNKYEFSDKEKQKEMFGSFSASCIIHSSTSTEDEYQNKDSDEDKMTKDKNFLLMNSDYSTSDRKNKRNFVRPKRRSKGTCNTQKQSDNGKMFENIQLKHEDCNSKNVKDDENSDIVNVEFQMYAKESQIDTPSSSKECTKSQESFAMPTNEKYGSSGEEKVGHEKSEDLFDDSTYHCPYFLHMDFETLDPSLAIGFVCFCEDDYTKLVKQLNEFVLSASSPPLFEILEKRPPGFPEFVPYSLHDESLKLQEEYADLGDPQFDSDDQFEILE